MQKGILSILLLLATSHAVSSQEARAVGLRGTVHTALTEEFTGRPSNHEMFQGSLFEIYDEQGYLLELFRYKPDGSVWVHTTYDRKGSMIFGYTIVASAPPFQSSSVRNIIDSSGDIIETDTFDGEGTLINKVRHDPPKQDFGSVVYRSQETDQKGTSLTREVVEVTDSKTGLTRQIDTSNGQVRSDWLIQRNAGGVPTKDKIVFADGSYNERYTKLDGTIVEDRYSPATNSHTHQITDARGNLVEVVQQSASDYIRCTYSYDDANRPTGQINYDSAGVILSKTTEEYRFDSHGNWIEKESINWDTKSEPAQKNVIATTLRTINYF